MLSYTTKNDQTKLNISFAILEPRPTKPFTILKPQDREISEFYSVQECRATDYKVPKL